MEVPFKIVFENGTDAQKEAVLEALGIAHEKLASEKFKQKVLSHKMPDGTEAFYQAEMTNAEVYEQLMKTPWEYSVRFYSKRITSARAYVNPGDPTVNLNWHKMGGENPAYTANTLVHENTHLKGFHHDYERTALRDWSVPYAVGQIIQDLILGVEDEPEVTPPVVRRSIWGRIKGFFTRFF